MEIDIKRLCECGCGLVVKPNSRFISGHNRRGMKNSSKQKEAVRNYMLTNNPAKRPEVAAKISISNSGKKQSLETRLKRSISLTNNPKVIAARIGNKNRKDTSTSSIARRNMSIGALGKVYSKSHKEAISLGLRKHFSIVENRIRRAKEIASRIQLKGYQYKTGYIHLVRLDCQLHYRSSYEMLALILLDQKEEVVKIDVETVYIPYVNRRCIKVYTPDLLVTLDDGKKILIEIKPNAFVNSFDVQKKIDAGIAWTEDNDITFCIWTEDILHNSSSTTTSLQEIVKATVAYSRSKRYSLNPVVTQGKRQK